MFKLDIVRVGVISYFLHPDFPEFLKLLANNIHSLITIRNKRLIPNEMVQNCHTYLFLKFKNSCSYLYIKYYYGYFFPNEK